MSTAGGNEWVQLPDEEHRFTVGEAEELAARWEVASDPSVRDVLARLDQIEAKIGALGEQVGAINARIDELMKPVLYVGQTPPNTEVETK